ncbi:response regulator [Mucilaginibacter panaciglaebae]|uniref:Response regulator n=1 Tax=Mucilaginibacter panaciglaebae TaxID=502331 RepID=A0ABP7WF16_9SPHI
MTDLLILDDDPLQHMVLQLMIDKYCPCKVRHYYDGNSVIDYLNEHSTDYEMLPDVIFLDINMPQITGWQFLENYKTLAVQLKKNIDIYIVSSSIHPHDLKRVNNYPFVKSYLIKPLTREILEASTVYH